jgi:DNA-binding response OmpR family regulator
MSESRILIIDDEESVVRSIKRLFHAQKEWTVDAITDASLIDAKLKEFDPDLVIVDVMMPGVDGFEVVRRLRKKSDTTHIKIVALSGNYPEDGKEMLLSMGVVDCVDKPYNSQDFIRLTKDVLRGYIQ